MLVLLDLDNTLVERSRAFGFPIAVIGAASHAQRRE